MTGGATKRNFILVTFLAGLLLGLLIYTSFYGGDREQFEFVVIGDSQGKPGLDSLVGNFDDLGVDFVIHLGDSVPLAREGLFQEFMSTINKLNCTFHMTPGNHDVKGNDSLYYSYFGAGDYYFDRGGFRFISLDTSSQDISEDQFAWLENTLRDSGPLEVIVFTHVPPYNPLPHIPHSLRNQSTSVRFMDLMSQQGVRLVLSGHVHLFNSTKIKEVQYLVSGGGGADLVATPEEGGFHHYLHFEAEGEDLNWSVVPFDLNNSEKKVEICGSQNVTLSMTEVMGMDSLQSQSSFQNNFGNWRAQGLYRGVPIRDLVELVGGMDEGDRLEVISSDGYMQTYCYPNVYPNSSWQQLQGDMILAYEFNGTFGPQWEKGPLIVFTPPDGGYSNEDCVRTSFPGQGCSNYLSGGSRWIKDVERIIVVPGEKE